MADIKINAFGKTDVGLMRTINQDSIFVSTQPIGKLPNLFIVADGMGGIRQETWLQGKPLKDL